MGECTGVFEVENTMEMEAMLDDETKEDLLGEATVRIIRDRKGKIWAAGLMHL